MKFLLIAGLFLLKCLLSEGAPVTYDLDATNPSFILYGQDLDVNTTVIVNLPTNGIVQINGLFREPNKTFFLITSVNLAFSALDLQRQGYLRVPGPVGLKLLDNSTNNFYLSFVLYPGDDKADSTGLNNYQLFLFTGESVSRKSLEKIPPFYVIEASQSSAAMITIINQKYSKDACYDFDLQQVQIRDNCAMTLYAGAAPSYNPNLYTIDSVSRSNYLWPTLSAASYTFFVNTSCAATFSLINYVPGTRSFTSATDTQSSVVSCDYPGLKYSRKEAVKPFQLTFDTTDPSTYSIRTTYVQVNAGTGGSLGVQVLEKGNVTSDWNSTSTSPAPPDGIGHSLKVNWVPGGDERKGFLLKWAYDKPTIYYMSAAHDPVIFDSRNDPFSNRIVTGSTIQVNVKIINFVQEIYFYNGKQNISLSTLTKGPQVFQDSVQITPNTINLSPTQYIAAFTSYTTQSDYPGLTDYTLLNVAQNGTTNIMISSKNNTQALTFTRFSLVAMFLGNVTVTGDDTCNVELFVSGIPPPSIRDRMKLFNFNPSSTTSKTFIRSAIRSASATLIVPPNCAFSADIAQMSDTIENLSIGSAGFLMSPEYPGIYENSQGYIGYSRQNSETHFCNPSASIEGNILNPNMGFYANTKGVLNITITGTKGANSLIIDRDSPSGGHLVADGNILQVDWHTVTGSQGFLLQYNINEPKSGASSLFGLASLLLALVYYAY
ncbi:unnamed protein product, partial [Mesorhabditis belari]|uniref:CUB-like domain-containing protein n=1 Tax=Mesorhabditis belari TaxID=2138241 RepID=A0AAF3JAN4_9BILA